MEFPTKIRITSKISYEIVWVPTFDCPKTVGECRYESKQIVLRQGESPTNTFKTLLHEVLHAMEFEYKIDIPHKTIYGLEHAIERVLKLNSWVKKK